ncbi:cyclase family protein [Arthrobacter sp. zg-Y1110]|uniref:cyclase family protein n=1 Tax=Arthrobacter sp. zg-Y1110 TaxID=2886932 RepID=UPI001D132A70|nr:cyclase family protein [Arthrobacter sp. zg-Y1110]MCC3290838.1 cyclase family protein [Arthrobacter sp. zg-Y1110]UWX86253.1 cyclase family protein [Arthrobacter sp. zg-Y1110]
MQVVDLSHPIRTGMQVFPGDPSVELNSAATVAADGFAVAQLHLGSHTGTHLDAPLHTVQDGTAVDAMPLEALMGPARIVSLPEPAANTVLRWKDVSGQLAGLLPGTIVLFSTGWSRYFNTGTYLQHPAFDAEIAERLVTAGVRLVGVDTLNPDPTPGPAESGQAQGGTFLPFHDVFLGSGGGIVENLTNLDAVPWPEPWFSALPLRLEGLDGSPVRAVALKP